MNHFNKKFVKPIATIYMMLQTSQILSTNRETLITWQCKKIQYQKRDTPQNTFLTIWKCNHCMQPQTNSHNNETNICELKYGKDVNITIIVIIMMMLLQQ